MKTTQTTPHAQSEFPSSSLNTEEAGQAKSVGAADKTEDTTIMHDAQIITPHPYGVYGLCKIIEHLQNN